MSYIFYFKVHFTIKLKKKTNFQFHQQCGFLILLISFHENKPTLIPFHCLLNPPQKINANSIFSIKEEDDRQIERCFALQVPRLQSKKPQN